MVATDKALWESIAYYAIHDHENKCTRNDNDHIMWGTIQLYIRKLLTALKRKFEASRTLTTVMFFTCLDKQGNSTAWKWLKDLFRQIERKIGLRIADTGEAADNSARPCYPSMLQEMNRAYAKLDSSNSLAVNSAPLPNLWPLALALLHLLCSLNMDYPGVQAAEAKVSLTAQLHSGSRASELAWGGSWNNAKWCSETQCVYLEFIQVKTSKPKPVTLTAGGNHYLCAFMNFGDYFCHRLPGLSLAEGIQRPGLHCFPSPGAEEQATGEQSHHKVHAAGHQGKGSSKE